MNKDTKDLKNIINEVVPPKEYVDLLNNCSSIDDLDFKTLSRLLMVLNPQKRTAIIEKRLKLHFGWVTVDPKADKGDYIDSDNKFFELKTSCPNSSNKIMIRQVRIWQPVNYYLILYIDCYNLENSQAFTLTKEEMEVEACKRGSGSHKTKAASAGDKKRELSFTIDVSKDSPENKEWTELYGNKEILKDILTF